jgi:phage shock protein A
VLEDVGGGGDDIQKELDEVGKSASVDNELAALKAQLGAATPTPPEALAAAPASAPASAEAPNGAPN